MIDVILNFSETDAIRDFADLLPIGKYDAVIDASFASKVEYTKTEKETPFVNIGFVIKTPGEFENKIVTQRFYLSGRIANFTKRVLKNFGLWDEEMGDQVRFNFGKLHGLECSFRVKHNPGLDGTPRNEITTVIPR